MTTTVTNIRGQSPDEWQAQPGNVYVGRRLMLRSGKFAGQLWRPSLFANPIKLPSDPTRAQKRDCIERFLEWLADDAQDRVRRGIVELRGKRLGCWCGNWSGEFKPSALLCHAVIYAVLADHWRPGMDVRGLVGEWMDLGVTVK